MENLIRDIESEQIPLLGTLVGRHPVYGAAGQYESARLIHETLAGNGWDRVMTDTYTSREIVDEPDYVSVTDFGEYYHGDSDRQKRNVYGVIDGQPGGPTVILNGHYDVDIVSDPELWDRPYDWISGRIVDGRMVGRGTTDMLGGLTSLMSVGSYFAARKHDWHGRILLSAVTDEEIGGNGTVRSFTQFEKLGLLDGASAMGLIAEPSDGIIAQESLGFMHLQFSAARQSRHMGTAERQNNALYDMIDVIRDFDTILDTAAADQDLACHPALMHNFGVIAGGKDAAIPIGNVQSEATVFYPATVSRQSLEKSISEQIYQRHGSVVSIRFSEFGFRGHTSRVGRLSQALLDTAGINCEGIGTFKSPCDARIFETYGVDDVCVYGPGSLAQAHSINESLKLDELQEYNRHILNALSNILNK